MSPRRILLPLTLIAAPVLAEDVVRLSPADREAALEAGAANAPINGAPGLDDGRIHGEMGVAIGTGGMRSIYGTTVIPLGQTGTLGLAFENTQFGRVRTR